VGTDLPIGVWLSHCVLESRPARSYASWFARLFALCPRLNACRASFELHRAFSATVSARPASIPSRLPGLSSFAADGKGIRRSCRRCLLSVCIFRNPSRPQLTLFPHPEPQAPHPQFYLSRLSPASSCRAQLRQARQFTNELYLAPSATFARLQARCRQHFLAHAPYQAYRPYFSGPGP
jgi:hypothetical protein